ncbi:LPS export ABC transporter periplasmic protein LptC [candidate division KSB1 bacterium 4484_87]|nr:MAG: LPS export ABC transporter periplasmic protein LptC [candidate division KSB1 bacterium 4484_87]
MRGVLLFLLKRIFILFFLIGIFASCAKKEDADNQTTESTVLPEQEAWNSKVTSTVDGKLKAVIRYGHMQRFKQKKIVEFDSGITIDFYDEKGEHTSKLTSERGKLNEGSNDIEAFGNVVVVSDSGINLQTEHLYWDNGIEKVVSDTFVTITSAEQDTFYGIGFESDQYLNNWVIRRIYGKANRGLDLVELEKKEKEAKKDTTDVDSTAEKKDIVPDSLSSPESNKNNHFL